MSLIFRSLLLFVLGVMGTLAHAQPVEGLYRVHEPLANQQPEAREEGMRRALDALVQRLTGKDAAKVPALSAARANPQQWVTRYGYENGGLLVDFDPPTVQSALRQAGLTLWGAERPEVLVWWLSESAQGGQLFGDGQDSTRNLRTAAQYRGLPLLLPLADLSEQLAVTPALLQSTDVEPLRAASARYDAQGLLAVYAREVPEGWQADWQYWMAERHTKGQLSASTQEALADGIMLATQTFMASLLAGKVTAPPTETLLLELQGATLARFAELDRVLAPLGKLILVDKDRLLYRLDTHREALKAQLVTLHLQELSAEVQSPPLVTGNTPLLRYRW